MRQGEEIRLVIEFEVADAARFTEMAEAMAAVSKDEPGTLVYDWYLDADAGKGKLYEAYDSFDSIVAHGQGAVFTELAPKFADAMTISQIDVFGAADKLAAGGDVLGAPTTWWGAAVADVS